MNTGIIKLGMIGVFVPFAIVSGAKAEKARLIEYNITPIETPIMDACKSAMSRYDVEFSQGAGNADGCACISKYATSKVVQSRHAAFAEIYTYQIKGSKIWKKASSGTDVTKEITALEESITGLQAKYKLTERQVETLAGHAGEFLNTCGQSSTHKKESVAKIAMMSPKNTPRRKVATAKPKAEVPALRK